MATSKWDEVDQSSWESFPASDPPSWLQQRALGSLDDKLPDHTPPRASRIRVARIVGYALVTLAIAVRVIGRRRRKKSLAP